MSTHWSSDDDGFYRGHMEAGIEARDREISRLRQRVAELEAMLPVSQTVLPGVDAPPFKFRVTAPGDSVTDAAAMAEPVLRDSLVSVWSELDAVRAERDEALEHYERQKLENSGQRRALQLMDGHVAEESKLIAQAREEGRREVLSELDAVRAERDQFERAALALSRSLETATELQDTAREEGRREGAEQERAQYRTTVVAYLRAVLDTQTKNGTPGAALLQRVIEVLDDSGAMEGGGDGW